LRITTELETRPGGQVARLTLDHPRKLNSLTRAALAGLVDAMREAQVALHWSLLEKVSKINELDPDVNSALDAILAGEPEAIRAQKRLCRLWEEAPLAESVHASIDEFARCYESGEPGRRVAAFRQRRRRG